MSTKIKNRTMATVWMHSMIQQIYTQRNVRKNGYRENNKNPQFTQKSRIAVKCYVCMCFSISLCERLKHKSTPYLVRIVLYSNAFSDAKQMRVD